MIDFVYNLAVSLKNLKYLKQKTFVGFGSVIINSQIGKNVKIGTLSYIKDSILQDHVGIGMLSHIKGCHFGRHSYIGKNSVAVKADIGAFTSISWNVTIGAAEHKTDIITTHNLMYEPSQGFVKNERAYNPHKRVVIIGNDVWIGANVVIKQGVKIGDGAVIGAGSVVTKDIPDYAIAVGVPTKVVRYRFSKKTIRELKRIKWWEWPDNVIKSNLKIFSSNPENPEVIEKLWRIKENAHYVQGINSTNFKNGHP